MHITGPHPPAEELAAFGLGQLDDTAAEAIAAHLRDCPACCSTLEAVPADAFVAKVQTAARQDTERDAAACSPAGPDTPGAPTPDPELARHPRYHLIEVPRAGGMGVVYKAEHRLMERPVALKVTHTELTQDPAAVECFRREVKAAARLHHPNIVTAYDADQAGQSHFLVM